MSEAVHILFPLCLPLAAWLVTYLLHSTLLFGTTLLAIRLKPLSSSAIRDLLWKFALIGPLLTATFQVYSGWGTFTFLLSVSSGLVSLNIPEPLNAEAVAATFGSTLAWRSAVIALVAGWLWGAFVLLIRYQWLAKRFLADLATVDIREDTPLYSTSKRLCLQFGIRGRVRLKLTPGPCGPMAVGSGAIILPDRVFKALPPEHLEAILAHEIAHLARRDPLWLKVSKLLECVFFFHPLQGAMRRRLQEIAEEICDAMAVRATGDQRALARCLIEVASWARPLPAPGIVHEMAATPSALHRRIKAILAVPRDLYPHARLSYAYAFAFAAVLALPAAAPGVSILNTSPFHPFSQIAPSSVGKAVELDLEGRMKRVAQETAIVLDS